MNRIEKIVYDVVKASPWIKNAVRDVYQCAFDLFPRKRSFFLNQPQLKEGFFFGFHDINPFSEDSSRILANKPTVFLDMPSKSDELEVGYFDFVDGKLGGFNRISSSTAWNHHKGCRLQWLGDNKIIYNSNFNNSLCANIVDIETKSQSIIDFPIDTVSPDQRYATNFSYERLEALMPGYGYIYRDDSYLAENFPAESGLFLIDITSNTRKLLVSLRDLVAHLDDPDAFSRRHYVTHSAFSHDGRYISFLHRWVGDDLLKRWSRLMVYDLHTSALLTAPTNGMVSHYVWNKKLEIIAYCRVGQTDGHFLFNVHNINQYRRVASVLNSDGHQSFASDTCFVTDTYPDKFRMAKLYVVDMNPDQVKLIASMFSPKKYQSKLPFKHIACDLHPRVSNNAKFVCFDTVYSGVRSLCVMSLE